MDVDDDDDVRPLSESDDDNDPHGDKDCWQELHDRGDLFEDLNHYYVDREGEDRKEEQRKKVEVENEIEARLLGASKELSPRLVGVLKVAGVWTKRKRVHQDDSAMTLTRDRLNNVTILVPEIFVKKEVQHLSTLAVRAYGLTPTKLVNEFHLTIGAATRLKTLAVEADKKWCIFAGTHGLDINAKTDAEWDKATKKRKREEEEEKEN